MSSFYLAGPFFNAVQKAHALKVLAMVRGRYEHDVYAPVEHGVVIDSENKANVVFDENVDQLLKCDVLLAQIEWLLPPDAEVRLLRPFYDQYRTFVEVAQRKGQDTVPVLYKSTPLNLPDTGTVWELGFAKMLKISRGVNDGDPPRPQIVAYSVGAQTKVNLMLSMSCDGYLSGWKELEAFIRDGELAEEQQKWKGGHL